jgi:hypothetical protein
MNTRTFEENLSDIANAIKAKIEELMLKYSDLRYSNPSGDGIVFINAYGDYYWQKLPLDGQRLQSQILQEYNKYADILRVLTNPQTKDRINSFENNDKIIRKNIEQGGSTWCKTTKEALDETLTALDALQILLGTFHSKEKEFLFVPDTNALLYNPKIDLWRFKDVEKFTLILAPTILSELDELKINHKNQSVRQTSERLIKQIKEYRRRGSLIDGVTIIKNKIRLQSIAIEPTFSESLPWLDPENNDDRFIATVFEIVKNHLRSVVILVTRDINMQNKAGFSCLPYNEPPEPKKGKKYGN